MTGHPTAFFPSESARFGVGLGTLLVALDGVCFKGNAVMNLKHG